MAMLATDFKGIFSIAIKPRTDGITDQYNRIFMMKLLLLCTIITGLSWYNDNLNCNMPGASSDHPSSGFVSQSCWVQGLYIYREVRDKFDDTAYFGIPKDLDHDGLVRGHLCATTDKYHGENEICIPMTPTYYLQYQWMPFYLCAIALLYYLPYMFHRSINGDLFSLKNDMKEAPQNCPQKIFNHYFGQNTKKKNLKMRYTLLLLNIAIKLTYVAINLFAFINTDSFLEYRFKTYGTDWLKWSQMNNSMQFDYDGNRRTPKPANDLLPPFGYCEFFTAAKDKKNSFGDKHKVLCEISQFVLYQYTFLVLWFAIVIGITLSCLGVVLLIAHYAFRIGFRHRKIKHLAFRQREYLEYIRTKSPVLYGEIVKKLLQQETSVNQNGKHDSLPLYEKQNQKLKMDMVDSQPLGLYE